MSRLERRYRRLMQAYPSAHRARHEEEIISTLLDVAAAGQHRPRLREAVAILTAGLGLRFQDSSELKPGLQLAGVFALTATFAMSTMPIILAAQRPAEIGLTPLLAWFAVVGVAIFGAWATSTYRLLPATTLTLVMLVVGSPMMGLRRSILVPTAVFLVLSAFSRPTRNSVRSAAAMFGIALGSAHGVVISANLNQVLREADSPWVYNAQWDIASDLALINPELVFIVWPFAAIAAVLRRQLRYAVTAAVLTAPFVVLGAFAVVFYFALPQTAPFYFSVFAATLALVITVGASWLGRHQISHADGT